MPDTYFMWTLEKLQEFWDDHISTLFARKSSVYTKTEIDTKTAALGGAMAVVQSTDTATVAISAGRYVIWKGNLCVALSAIAIGDTLSSSNLTAVSDGGLNALDASRISGDTALGGRIDSVISDIAIIVDGDTCSVSVPDGGYAYIKNNTHGLAEGLYKNTSGSAFPVSGGSATSSVFTAVSGGLGSEVTSLNSNLISTSISNIGATGHESSVQMVTWGKLAQIVFTGAYYGVQWPSGLVPKAMENARFSMIGGSGAERYPVSGGYYPPTNEVSLYLNKNGGETAIPKDGSINVFGVWTFIRT